ncbi:MAG: hypothetical protein KQH63_19995 [Desulfobulbaceae bacterium]|nr:hypothetical protein [Desulfobulbaceae bacterium]
MRRALRYHDYPYSVRNEPVIADSEYDWLFESLQKVEEKYNLNFPS